MTKLHEYIKPLEAVISPLSAFFTGTTLTCMGYALLTSTLSVQMNLHHVPTAEIGLILSLYYAGYILASVTASKIINKVGHIRAFSAYISIFSALALMHIFSYAPVFWALLRLIEGYCIGSSMMCLESWLNARTTNQNRGLIMALYMVTTYLGSGLGQLLLNIPSPDGILVYITVSIIFSVALVPVSLTALPAPDISLAQSMKLSELYRTSPVGTIGCLCSGVFVGAFYTLGTVYAAQNGLDIAQTSIFMFCGILGGMLAQIPVGRLSDRLDRRFVIMWTCGAMFLSAPWIQFFLNSGTALLSLSALLLGACTFIIYPICVSHINDLIDDSRRTNASGRLIMLQSIGMIIGPIIISFAMQHFGSICFPLAFSAVAGLFVLFAFKHIACRPIHYVDVTPATPQPITVTPVYHKVTQSDTIIDKAKDLLSEKKH